MNLITLAGVSFHYGEVEPLRGVDLQIGDGDRFGLIGVNGSGKTTLLRVVAGELKPDDGTVTRSNNRRFSYLPQMPELDPRLTVLEQLYAGDTPSLRLLMEYDRASLAVHGGGGDAAAARLHDLAAEMDRTGGWAAEARAKAILTRLGIGDFEQPIGALSGGQRKRVALAHALIDPADLLILDEPTNHLDAETLAWLEEFLRESGSALLMVTHDRYFLDRVSTGILELERGRLTLFPGNYRSFLEAKETQRTLAAERETTRRNLLKRELEWLSRFPKARGTKPKARIQRVQEMLAVEPPYREKLVVMALAGRRLGKEVLTVRGLGKSWDGIPLFSGIDFILKPGDRIGVVGANGTGKTTFLNLLAGRGQADAGTIEWGTTAVLGYMDQENAALDPEQTLIGHLDSIAPHTITHEGQTIDAAKMLEWFLFPRSLHRTRISRLSGGERRRLHLLGVLARRPNVLFLDEPTNDLDIQTLGVLEEYLDHFAGTLLVVSHDRWFLDRTVDFLVHFREGSVTAGYPGPFSAFLERIEEERRAAVGLPAARPNPARQRTVTEKRGLTRREEEELLRLENRIAELEALQGTLEEQMHTAASDYTRLQELAERGRHTADELEAVMERWLELSERAR